MDTITYLIPVAGVIALIYAYMRANWINRQDGPPPVTPYGGVTDIAPGDTILARIDFTPGNYSVTCRVRAATDGVTHDLHGMNMGFTVE